MKSAEKCTFWQIIRRGHNQPNFARMQVELLEDKEKERKKLGKMRSEIIAPHFRPSVAWTWTLRR